MVSTIQLAPTDAPLIGGWTSLAQDALQHSHTGDLVETTFATVSIPAGRMGPNGFLRITTLWSYVNTTGSNKTQRIKFAGNNLYNAAQTAVLSLQIMTIIRNRNAQNSQVCTAVNASIGVSSGGLVLLAVDTSIAQNLTITGQLANATDAIALEGYSVDLLYGA